MLQPIRENILFYRSTNQELQTKTGRVFHWFICVFPRLALVAFFNFEFLLVARWLVRWLLRPPLVNSELKSISSLSEQFSDISFTSLRNAYFLYTALEKDTPTAPPTTTPPPVSCGVKVTNRSVSGLSVGQIIGGKISTPGAWPWQVAIMCKTCKSQDCGGTLVSAYHVVTAAHCVPSSIGTFIKDYKVGIVSRHWLRTHVVMPTLSSSPSSATNQRTVAAIWCQKSSSNSRMSSAHRKNLEIDRKRLSVRSSSVQSAEKLKSSEDLHKKVLQRNNTEYARTFIAALGEKIYWL